jgi:putative ribosome biogenesis GTPase RsgA
VVLGESGVGKSTLLANWALDWRKRNPESRDGIDAQRHGSTEFRPPPKANESGTMISVR